MNQVFLHTSEYDRKIPFKIPVCEMWNRFASLLFLPRIELGTVDTITVCLFIYFSSLTITFASKISPLFCKPYLFLLLFSQYLHVEHSKGLHIYIYKIWQWIRCEIPNSMEYFVISNQFYNMLFHTLNWINSAIRKTMGKQRNILEIVYRSLNNLKQLSYC